MPNEHPASNKKSTHCKHKKNCSKHEKTGINYNNANTEAGTDGQTWRRLKQISIVVFVNLFSVSVTVFKVHFDVFNFWLIKAVL